MPVAPQGPQSGEPNAQRQWDADPENGNDWCDDDAFGADMLRKRKLGNIVGPLLLLAEDDAFEPADGGASARRPARIDRVAGCRQQHGIGNDSREDRFLRRIAFANSRKP